MRGILLVFVVISTSQAFPKEDYFTHPIHRLHGSFTPGLRIIGGQDATPHAYPYQVGLYVKTAGSGEFCGGSLISPNYVLTAAHCAEKAVKMDLVFGAHDITANESTQIRVTATQFTVHPAWKRSTKVNDIALVKLSSPIKETNSIKIVKLASGSSVYAGSKGIVAGWGMTFNNQKTVTPKLKYIISTILSNDDCKKVSPDYNKVIIPTFMCLSVTGTGTLADRFRAIWPLFSTRCCSEDDLIYRQSSSMPTDYVVCVFSELLGQGTVGTCQGDSGGPLVVDGVQVGIVSFGYSDCSAGFPSVFTRLTEYKDWITKNSDVKY